jgi:Cu(I)/Ag(I) efflux system membrane fusion protein
MDLIPLEQGSGIDDPAILSMTETAMQLADVQTTKVEFKDPGKEISLQGKVEVDETRTSTQSIHFPARIENLYVTFEGEQVKKGQKLARVYSPELVTAQKELLEAIRSATANPRLVESARNKLRFWKIPESTINEIEASGKILEKIDIRTDVGGFVQAKKVAVGDYVKAGQVLFEIINLDRVWVNFEAYEADISFIRRGDTVRFTINAFPDREFMAPVRYIDPLIDKQKRTISVRTEVNNREHILKPEMFVYGHLYASLEQKKVMAVPKSAVMWTGERSIVYVRLPDYEAPAFELKEVKLGASLNGDYVILKGLKEGDEVVSSGTFTVDAAAQLSNKYSMMNMPGGKDEIDFASAVPETFSTQLGHLLDAYLVLKQAMVNTDSLMTRSKAGIFMEVLEQMDATMLDGPMKDFWTDHLKVIRDGGLHIAGTSGMAAQRAAFKPFSAQIIEVYKSFGVPYPVFVQYCPMADADRGGFWLSDKKQIENPYFGDLMMECGEVKEQLY